jgi:rSAM/selenodomain-associated transferase 1
LSAASRGSPGAAPAAVLVVFAKAPRRSQVKTRLCPPFSAEQAALLYSELLADVLAATARFAPRLGLQPILAVHPPEACAELAARAPAAFRVVRQRGGSLAERMAWAVREAAAGAQRILLRGSDSPLLGGEAAEQALRALDASDLSVCPDRDGGYNLIGLRRPAPGLFDHPMSTTTVLHDTLANAKASGLRVALQEPGFDLDRAADLRWLRRARPQAERLCPRTLAFLDSGDLWRLADSG